VNIGIPEWIQQPRPEFAVLELDHVIVSAGLDFLKICAFAVRAVCETHADKCEDDKTAPVGRHVAKACLAPNLNVCDFGVGSIGSLGIGQKSSTALWGVREPIPSVWFGWLLPIRIK
jgi:hypothetical protein